MKERLERLDQDLVASVGLLVEARMRAAAAELCQLELRAVHHSHIAAKRLQGILEQRHVGCVEGKGSTGEAQRLAAHVEPKHLSPPAVASCCEGWDEHRPELITGLPRRGSLHEVEAELKKANKHKTLAEH